MYNVPSFSDCKEFSWWEKRKKFKHQLYKTVWHFHCGNMNMRECRWYPCEQLFIPNSGNYSYCFENTKRNKILYSVHLMGNASRTKHSLGKMVFVTLCMPLKKLSLRFKVCILCLTGWWVVVSGCFRSISWSSHFWRCLPQMQAKCQEFLPWDQGPPAWKTPYTLMSVIKALTNTFYGLKLPSDPYRSTNPI